MAADGGLWDGGLREGRCTVVRLEAVGKRYGLRQPWVIRHLSLELAAGELIKVEGRNGSGKSTLLRVAAGVAMPSTGRVTGRPHTGYVPERFPGGLALSAREYLQHMGRIHGLREPAVAAAAEEWLGRLGASDYAASPLRVLSKGMCQKIAIAQALLARPGLLVLDEAWTGLDQAARGTLDAAVAGRVADGGIVLFVDHDPARLAGGVSQRWRLDGGLVTVSAGDGGPAGAACGAAGAAHGAAGAARGAAGAARSGADPTDGRVVIEVDSSAPTFAEKLALVRGVLAVSAEPESDGASRVRLTVGAAYSDGLLRNLLSRDDVHVVTVRSDLGDRQ